MQKVVELALGCLHKLVAHAWLHGESTAAGTMDILSAHGSLDDDDTVANVIKMVIKCGETTNEALQLAVVRALLTFTTAGKALGSLMLQACSAGNVRQQHPVQLSGSIAMQLLHRARMQACPCARHDWPAPLVCLVAAGHALHASHVAVCMLNRTPTG